MSREKVREYAVATGVADPLYTADPAEVPSADLVAPPTFATCFTIGGGALFADPVLGAHPNLVHGSQEFIFSRAVRPGDLLACTPHIVDIVDRTRMELLTYEIDCRDAHTQAPVVTARSVIIFFAEPEA